MFSDTTKRTAPGGLPPLLKVGVLWRSYGPYHFDRLDALRAAAQDGFRILGVEISDRSKTYGWTGPRYCMTDFQTLIPGATDAEVGLLATIRKLWGWMRRNEPDVIFIPSFWPAYAFIAILLGRARGSAIVVMTDSHERSGRNSISGWMVKRAICTCADAAFVAGELSARYMRRLGVKVVVRGYDAIHNDYFSKEAANCRMAEDDERVKRQLEGKYLLSLGRFVAKKNLLVVVRAYALAWRNGWTLGNGLLFVGDGPMRDDIVREARRCGLDVYQQLDGVSCDRELLRDGCVEVRSFAQRPDIPGYYAFATGLIFASSTEEWGLVANEAMASGCVVIGSSELGCALDLLDDDVTALVFAPTDVERLAECIRRVCSSQALRERLTSAARSRIDAFGLPQFAMAGLEVARVSFHNRGSLTVI